MKRFQKIRKKLTPSTKKTKYILPVVVCIIVILILGFIYFFGTFSNKNHTAYIYIDRDDNIDSVFAKIDTIAGTTAANGFRILARHSSMADHVLTGKYEINPGDKTFNVFRKIKNGQKSVSRLTVPSVRTKEKLAHDLGERLMIDSIDIITMLNDNELCQSFGLDTNTIVCLFVPNTYEVYWDMTENDLINRMKKEWDAFWNDSNSKKAEELGLSRVEVATLASIVDEETANNSEKPMIAGLYYNRLQKGMLLQADPTVKFAMKNFEARRIYNDMLQYDSPYNTYKYPGLPPGPIRIPSIAGLDAVLNKVSHNYIYMCAKEDFSGTHNFAVTYTEHQQNAARYIRALNERKIK